MCCFYHRFDNGFTDFFSDFCIVPQKIEVKQKCQNTLNPLFCTGSRRIVDFGYFTCILAELLSPVMCTYVTDFIFDVCTLAFKFIKRRLIDLIY